MAARMSRTTLCVRLVRHGQSRWNAAGLLQGQTAHVSLTDLGHRQARAVADHLAGQPVDALLTSDLARAVQTADAVAAATGLAAHRDRRLREQCHGVFEGRPLSSLADPTVRVAGGESFADVCARTESLLRSCVDARPRDVVLVTHGETIRAALTVLSGRTPGTIPPNGSITTVTVTGRAAAVTVRTVVPSLDRYRLAPLTGRHAVWCDAESDGSGGSRCESDAVPPL
jgi:broad specificity phosphatase PhoE